MLTLRQNSLGRNTQGWSARRKACGLTDPGFSWPGFLYLSWRELQVLTLLEDVEGLGGHAQDRVYLKCSMKLQGGGPLLDQELSLA